MDISKKLKQRRKEIGLTMLDVAIAVGVSEGTVSRWESGEIANMRRDKIVSLAKILRVPPSFIMERSGDALDGETQILSNYNRLNERGKEKVISYVEGLLENPSYRKGVNGEQEEGAKYTNIMFADDKVRIAAFGGAVNDGDDEDTYTT